jgi:hypothetical protein
MAQLKKAAEKTPEQEPQPPRSISAGSTRDGDMAEVGSPPRSPTQVLICSPMEPTEHELTQGGEYHASGSSSSGDDGALHFPMPEHGN